MASRPALGMEELIRKKVASLRYWKKTKLYKKHSNWKFNFSVMTYNILSQNAIENHRFLYRNCNPSFLMEDYRVSRILPEILQSRSDIICLQEVEEYVYQTRMRMVFEMNGFGSIFMRRTSSKTDGCAIVWRKDKFHFVGQNRIEFRTRQCKVLDRDNIGLIAVLRPNHQQAENILLHVATTHLIFNPKRGDVKLCQLRWLLAELDHMALIEVKDEVRHHHPVILCGDFNFQPHSPLYRFVENGRIDVANALSGDLSGQPEGKNSGKKIQFENLLLHKLGISDATRFEEIPRKEIITAKNSDKSVTSTLLKAETSDTPNSSHSKPNIESYPKNTNSTIMVEGDSNSRDSIVILETDSAKPTDSKLIVETDSNSSESIVILEDSSKSTNSKDIVEKDSNSTDSVVILETDSNCTESKIIPETDKNSTGSIPMDVGDVLSSKIPGLVTTLNNKELTAEITTQIQNDTKKGEEGILKSSMETSTNSPETTECFSHDFKFVPAYKFQDASQKSLVTSMVGSDLCTVDHIFYNVDSKNDSHSYREGALKLLSVYTLMNGEDLKELGGLPNAAFGSDHICLGAQFALCFHNRHR